MKLPWDERYLKISFHVIVTLTVAYALGVAVSGAAYVIANLGDVLKAAGVFSRFLLKLLSPVIVALITSYLLDPVVGFFQRLYDKIGRRPEEEYRPRTAGVILTFISISTIIGALALYTAMKLRDGQDMETSVIFARTVNDLSDFYASAQIKLKEWGVLEYASGYIEDFVSAALAFVENVGVVIVKLVTAAGKSMLPFLIGIIISIHLMRNKGAILRELKVIMDLFIPSGLNYRIGNMLKDIDYVFSGYIRGQLIDALIMAVLTGGWLYFLKVDFAVMIGVFSGLSNLIPYLGAVMAFILSVTVALFSGEPVTALYAGLGILVLQQIDAVFIVPKVVGKSVRLSPVMVLLSLSIAGKLFGLVGMFLAIPVAGIIKLFLTWLIEKKKGRGGVL